MSEIILLGKQLLGLISGTIALVYMWRGKTNQAILWLCWGIWVQQ